MKYSRHDNPELVVNNLNRLAKACLDAPQDPQSQEAAIENVLEEIEEERNRAASGEVVDCIPDLEIMCKPLPMLDDLLEGKSPIESLYQPPSGGHDQQVLISTGGHNIICLSRGIRPFQKVRIADSDMKCFRQTLPMVAKFLEKPEQLKAGELLENLERAAHASKDGEFTLSVIPLTRWQENSTKVGE
ncbi:MAG TPA: hypothetical protein VKZ53_04210 [Candidatus Angelobacter sp.]|nr:hypothetical protein [Candidatus Angelobacter sp.]